METLDFLALGRVKKGGHGNCLLIFTLELKGKGIFGGLRKVEVNLDCAAFSPG